MAISRFSNSTVANGFPKYQRFWDQSAVVIPESFESIATVTVGSGGVTTLGFSGIPQTYKHLQVRAFTRDTRSTSLNNYHMQINGDTGNNYMSHSIIHDSSTITAAYGLANKTDYFIQPSANTTAGVFASSIWDILEYSSTDRYKVIKNYGGYDNNGSGRMNYNSGLWLNTNAIDQLVFSISGSGNFAQYTSYALYGIKG
jgi:hypothetical protein